MRAADPRAAVRARAVLPGAVRVTDSALEAVQGARALVLCTEWEEFRRLDWEDVAACMDEPRFVFDGRNALDRERLEALGFRYQGVGRGRPVGARLGVPAAAKP